MVGGVEGGIHDTSMRKHGSVSGLGVLLWASQQRPTLSSNWMSKYFSSPASCESKVLANFWLSPEPSEHASLLVTMILYQSSVPCSMTCLQAFPPFHQLWTSLYTSSSQFPPLQLSLVLLFSSFLAQMWQSDFGISAFGPTWKFLGYHCCEKPLKPSHPYSHLWSTICNSLDALTLYRIPGERCSFPKIGCCSQCPAFQVLEGRLWVNLR